MMKANARLERKKQETTIKNLRFKMKNILKNIYFVQLIYIKKKIYKKLLKIQENEKFNYKKQKT